MSKNKPFQPPMGFVVAVHQTVFAIRSLADELNVSTTQLAIALEKSGFYLTPDIMDISADAGKVIALQEKQGHLKVVDNERASDNSTDGGDTTEGTE